MTKENQEDILKNINEQIGELLELIEKEANASFSTKFFNELKEKKHFFKQKWFIICLLLFISLSICWIYSSDEFIYNIYFLFLSFIRLILIKILPLWNWTTIYTSPCFVNNPYYNNSLELSECDKCINTTEVIRESNITFFNFTKNIYLNHLPVIVDDATQSWPAMKKFTIKKLFQLYIEDPILAVHDLCRFESNIRQYNQPGGVDRLFNDYISGTRRPFVAQWNNCKRETLKVLRSYYSKPYFLPPSVAQTLMGNWFFVSFGLHKGKERSHKVN
ncbi:hypothetical protein I4U23_012686 [Adineta vaga]|nr:hypothetical protein I4U23_012686 [Adineta vaga]